MDSMEGVGQLQRKHVVKKLMDLLKICYPGEHDYLLLRAKQYESLCYTRASTIQHYYHLANEGFRKIRTAYSAQHPAALNSALAASSGQQVNAGIQGPQQTLLVAASQGVSRAHTMVHQASKTTVDRTHNFANESNGINSTNPPNSAGSAFAVNPANKGVYNTNLPVHAHHNPTSQHVNQIQSTKACYMANPAHTMSQPLSAGNIRLNRLANPTLNPMIPISAPSAGNLPIHPMFKTVGNSVVTPTVIPSLNRISSQMALNRAIDPFSNSAANPGVNQVIYRVNDETSGQIINQKNNTNQSAPQNPRPMVNHAAVTAVSPTGNLRTKAFDVAAPIQAPGHEAKTSQQHSNGVDQFLLSMGMIPESRLSGPSNNNNRTRIPIGDSNQVPTIPPQPVMLPTRMTSTQNSRRDNRMESVMNEVPASSADSASSQPRSARRNTPGELFSHFKRPISTTGIGSKRARPMEVTVERSRPKKRNSSIARINTKENSSFSAQRGNLHEASKNVFNSVRPGPATSHQQNALQSMENTQRNPDGPRTYVPIPEEQRSLSHPSMEERVFISDSSHVSVGQVYDAAASCGYKLTAEKIKSLSREQVLRFFIRARQKALKEACNLPRGENGQVSVSKQQLDTLGVKYETNEPGEEQTCSAAAKLYSIQNSSTGMVQRDSLPANMEMDAIHTMPPTENLQSKTYQTNKVSQSVPKFIPRNSVQELPNNRNSVCEGGPDSAMRQANISKGLVGIAAQGKEKLPESQQRKTASEALVDSNGDRNLDAGRGTENLHRTSLNLRESTKARSKNEITASRAQATQTRPADTHKLRNGAATLTSRLTLFQQKYGVYRNLINQTLHFLISSGHEGTKQVLYMRYSLQLLTEPAALGSKLTASLLNTTENFLRDFLVRYQGIPMKSQPNQNNRTDGTKEKGSPVVNKEKRCNSSNAEITGTNQAHIAENAQVEKGVSTQSTTRTANLQATAGAETDQSNLTIKPQGLEPRQKGTSGTQPAQTSVPTKSIPDRGTQKATATTGAAVPDENLQSVIAQKLNRVKHYVRRALHDVEKCEKGLEQESMLRFKEERISDICNLFQYDEMKKARELKQTANDAGTSERSLLEVIKEECDGAHKKHEKLIINVKEKWNKPVVECLLAYQSIRLPKIVIHVGGTYRKDLSASFGFERPPFGWVPVLSDIKKRFIALMDEKDGVSTILDAWASAAKEVLEDDDVHK